MYINFDKLRNGTDIRGVAIEGIEGEKVNLTEEVINLIAASFTIWLSKKSNKNSEDLKISVGMDSRISGSKIKNQIIKSIENFGCTIYDFGMASTPAMFMSTVLKEYQYDGAIMITASHLPFNKNGMKFFTKEGGLEKEDIKNILSIAKELKMSDYRKNGQVKNIDFISVYSNLLVNRIREEVNNPYNKLEPLKGFRIVVDAGNGAGGFFVDKVLKPLGADTEGSQFIEPDGRFPNHIPNPEDSKAMNAIKEAVLKNNADLGIIFDTDVDRAAVVDSYGNEINRNRLIALISAIVLEEHPKSFIVTDSITSDGLKKFIEKELGGIHHRFKRGYKNVINEAIRLNKENKECNLAIETSGHGALKENYFLDDGAYLVSKILIKMAKLRLNTSKTIHSLIEKLEEPLESNEFRLKMSCENFSEYGNAILQDLQEYIITQKEWSITPNNYEGIRVSSNKKDLDGWFLLRLSLHDPVMPLNIESNSENGVKEIVNFLMGFLFKYKELNIESLQEYINEQISTVLV